MSTRPSTQHQHPSSQTSQASEIELRTLTIAAIASAVAAFVTSEVWPAGTLWSAAASPVIVALVKEGIRRPATRLGAVRRDVGTRLPGEPGLEEPEFEVGPVKVYGGSALHRNRWRLAVVTGLLAFVGV